MTPCTAGRSSRTRPASRTPRRRRGRRSAGDHQRVLPAQLQLDLHAAAGRRSEDAAAGVDRAGERDRRDGRVAGQDGPDLRAAPQDEVEHPGRQSRAVEDVDELPGAGRDEVGGLEHHRVAEREGGGDLPGRDGDGEVPRRDDADDADRLAGHRHLDAGPDGVQRLPVGLERDAGEVLEDLRGTHHLAARLGIGLALLAGEQVAELVRSRDDLRAGAVEHLGPLPRRRARPGRERIGGGRNGRLRDLRSADAGHRHHVAEVRRVDVGPLLLAGDRDAGDQRRQPARAHQRYAAMPVSASPTTSVCISLVPS